MPHLVVLYTPNLDQETDMTVLCRVLADAMLQTHDDDGKPVFPTGGTRVLAYPATHFAVADGLPDCGFCYINVRIAPGRSDAVKKATGDALLVVAQARFTQAFEEDYVGVTIQIDEPPGQVYDAKHSNLHPLFNK